MIPPFFIKIAYSYFFFVRWFHGSLSAKEAEKLLCDHGQNGSYLVRESQSNPDDFVLSAQADNRVTHIKIRCHDDKYDINDDDKFTTMLELIEHYKSNPMVETCGTIVQLLYPLNPTTIIANNISEYIEQLQKQTAESDPVKVNKYYYITGSFFRFKATSKKRYHHKQFSLKYRCINLQDGLGQEFESLQQQESKYTFSRSEGHRIENRNKNRYKNILPCKFNHT